MLVLTVKEGQKVYIGPDTVITAVECGRNKVRIGIDTPKRVPIVRETLSDEAVQGVIKRAAKES